MQSDSGLVNRSLHYISISSMRSDVFSIFQSLQYIQIFSIYPDIFNIFRSLHISRYLQYIQISSHIQISSIFSKSTDLFTICIYLFKIYVSLELRELQYLERTPVAVHIWITLNELFMEISVINPGT